MIASIFSPYNDYFKMHGAAKTSEEDAKITGTLEQVEKVAGFTITLKPNQAAGDRDIIEVIGEEAADYSTENFNELAEVLATINQTSRSRYFSSTVSPFSHSSNKERRFVFKNIQPANQTSFVCFPLITCIPCGQSFSHSKLSACILKDYKLHEIITEACSENFNQFLRKIVNQWAKTHQKETAPLFSPMAPSTPKTTTSVSPVT